MPNIRRLHPIYNLEGRLTNWCCPACSWIKRVEGEFEGLMVPGEATLRDFKDHRCLDHPVRAVQASHHDSGDANSA